MQPDLPHPAVAAVLRFFSYEHLKGRPREISRCFHELAWQLAVDLDGPELTVCLRKLLEAKDAAVRASLPSGLS